MSSAPIEKPQLNPTEFKFPPIWDDDDEIYDLMQDFVYTKKQKPALFARKMDFWSDLIEAWARHHRVCQFTEAELKSVFSRRIYTGQIESVQCLSTILREMCGQARLASLSSLTESRVGSQTSLLRSMVVRPLAWSWSWLTVAGGTSNTTETTPLSTSVDWVIPSQLEALMGGFLAWMADQPLLRVAPCVPAVSATVLDAQLAAFCPHASSRALIRQQLMSRGLARMTEVQLGTECGERTEALVVLAQSVESPTPANLSPQQVQLGAAVLRIRAVLASLEHSCEILDSRREANYARIRSLLQEKKRDAAKDLLRRTKIYDQKLSQKRIQMDNLESILLDLETSSDQSLVISALSTANQTLKNSNIQINGKDINRTEAADLIGDTMAEISDSMATQQELNETLADIGGFLPANYLDQSELEDELSRILSLDDDDNRQKVTFRQPSSMLTQQEKDLNTALGMLDLSEIQLPDVSGLPSPGKVTISLAK